MTAAAAEPKYISRLALQANPFSAEVGKAGLYLGPEIKQRLDLVLHLLRASDKIPLLYGPQGLGKTTTLKALMDLGGDDLRLCFIQSEPSLTIQFLVSRCLQVFGAPQESTLGSNNLQLLQQRLRQLRILQIRPVLLIDDASKLAEPLRQQLKVWLGWQHEGEYLWRAVVTDVEVDATFVGENDRAQSLMLSSIPPQQTASYLLQRLQGVGFNGDSPFNEKIVARFHRQSEGIPEKLNHLAHQFLLGQGLSKPFQLPASFKLPAVTFKWSKWFGLMSVGVLLAGVLFYQQQINDWFGSDKNAIEDGVVHNNGLTETLPMVVVNEPETLTSVTEADRLELLKLLDELEQTAVDPDAVSIEPEPETALKDEPAVAATPEPKIMGADVDVSDETLEGEEELLESLPAIAANRSDQNNDISNVIPEKVDGDIKSSSQAADFNNPIELIPAPVVALKAAIPSVDMSMKGKGWIMQQSKTKFTFQLMGTWDQVEVERFVKKHSLTGNVAVFKSMRDDKIWYALIYGVYPSKEVAMRSSKQWSPSLNKLSPWLRRYDGVQKQIIEKAPDR